jgi:hypothetical protein
LRDDVDLADGLAAVKVDFNPIGKAAEGVIELGVVIRRPGKNPDYGNRGKTNRVFPPFPQSLLLLIDQDEKQPALNNRRSFTQNI